MNTYLNDEYIKVYTSEDDSFLVIELKGHIPIEQYKDLLNSKEIFRAIEKSRRNKLFLKLTELWSIDMEQQDWTSKEYTRQISDKGVSQLAIGIAHHVYPAFRPFWTLYEKNAPISMRYFCCMADAAKWFS